MPASSFLSNSQKNVRKKQNQSVDDTANIESIAKNVMSGIG